MRFELDCEEGTIRCRVNDADQGIVFTGLQGQEVFPVVGRTGMQMACRTVVTVSPCLVSPFARPLSRTRLIPLERPHPCVARRTSPRSPLVSPHTRALCVPSHDPACKLSIQVHHQRCSPLSTRGQVCTYGDRRSVQFTKLEAEGVAGGLSSLAQTPELRSAGTFSRDGRLASGLPIVVNGVAQT